MIRRASVLAVVALTVGLVQTSPAVASTTGEVVFHCNFRVPAWPSAEANGRCDDSPTAATAVVSVSGVDDLGVPYTLAGPAPFDMVFTYRATCVAGAPPLLWAAAGTIKVGPVLAVRGGVSTSAVLTANVAIMGTPGEFTFTTANHRVSFGNGGTATGSTGWGEASLAAAPSVDNTCPAGGPLQGLVEGRWHLLT